jgi:hypothetical protein
MELGLIDRFMLRLDGRHVVGHGDAGAVVEDRVELLRLVRVQAAERAQMKLIEQ